MKLYRQHTISWTKPVWRLLSKRISCFLFIIMPLFVWAQHDEDIENAIAPAYDSARYADPGIKNIPDYHNDNNVFREVPDSTVERLKKDKDFLYANDPSYWKKKKRGSDSSLWVKLFSFIQSPFAKWALYILLGALLLFVLYQTLAVNNFFIFSRSAKRKKQKENEKETLVADDLDERISRAIRDNELRLAIRYLYLQTLQTLDKNKLIHFQAKATNHDYLQQMQGRPNAIAFTELTQVYEYVWYGEFEPSREQFEMIRKDFNHFINKD